MADAAEIKVVSHWSIPTWTDSPGNPVDVWMWTRARKKTRGPKPVRRDRAMFMVDGVLHVSPENFERMKNATEARPRG